MEPVINLDWTGTILDASGVDAWVEISEENHYIIEDQDHLMIIDVVERLARWAMGRGLTLYCPPEMIDEAQMRENIALEQGFVCTNFLTIQTRIREKQSASN